MSDLIGKAVVAQATGFILGTMFGMWLIVFVDYAVRGVCR